MTQHINLLHSERSESRDALQLLPVVGCMLVALTCAAAAGWYSQQRLAQAQSDARVARTATAAARQQTGTALALDTELARELDQARSRILQVAKVGVQLRELDTVRSQPFSSLFDALARRTLDGVWLTGLSADGDAQRLTLVGRAIEPDRVPLYLKELNHEPLLRERRFQAMEMREQETKPGTRVIEFRLSTTPIARRGS